MSMTAIDSEEYYCFRVKEGIGERFDCFDNENIVIIPRSYNFDLKKLRTELWKQFGVPMDRRIFYIDDDGDNVPIDSECEFHEALKLAKNAFMVNTAIPLIVGSFHMPTPCSDEQYSGTNDLCKESRTISDNIGNPVSCFPEKTDGPMESNSEFDKQKYPIQKILNPKKLDMKSYDESSEEQTESENVEVSRESNASLPCCSDTAAPLWFTEYMEAMKKDMVSTITNEVVKNVTEVLNKRLDFVASCPLKELGQFRNQSYSSLSKRHPRCSFDSNEKNQKRMRSQDEEQSSDTSIERVDEPQNVNAVEDTMSTIIQEVEKEVTSAPSKKQSRSQSHLPPSKRFSRFLDSHSSEKSQRKTRPQNGEQSSDDALKEQHVSQLWKKKLDLIEDTLSSMKEKRKKKHHRVAQATTDKNNDVDKEQLENNPREDFVPRKNRISQAASYDEILEMFQNDLRMSCSVTGHQILDEGRRRDVWCNAEIEKTTFWPCDQDEEGDDDAFEIIQMPATESRDESLAHPEEPVVEQRRHDSNRDSPSFELLSEPPSPTGFMHFNEEHFSANEGNPEQRASQFTDMNPPTSSIYVVDIHGKIYNENQLADLDGRVGAELEKRPGGSYSFVTETLPVQNTRCSKSLRPEQRSNEWKKSPRDDVDNASGPYDDVRNSHTSYLTVRTHCDSKTQSQCSCQSQTDSSDFTQSFHSHTTSITDTTDIYTEAYGSGRYGEQVLITPKDVREATTTTPRNDHDARVGGGCAKESRTNERHCHDADNYPECFCTPRSNTPSQQGTSVDPPPYQSARASGSSDRSSSNVGSRKASIGEQMGTADPVHILPETLVTAAAHVGLYAYDTAREVFDKIRAHTREDSVKRRGALWPQILQTWPKGEDIVQFK